MIKGKFIEGVIDQRGTILFTNGDTFVGEIEDNKIGSYGNQSNIYFN